MNVKWAAFCFFFSLIRQCRSYEVAAAAGRHCTQKLLKAASDRASLSSAAVWPNERNGTSCVAAGKRSAVAVAGTTAANYSDGQSRSDRYVFYSIPRDAVGFAKKRIPRRTSACGISLPLPASRIDLLKSTSSGRIPSPSQHVRPPPGFCCGWPDGLELSLPDNLRDPELITNNFKRLLKTFLFSAYQCN